MQQAALQAARVKQRRSRLLVHDVIAVVMMMMMIYMRVAIVLLIIRTIRSVDYVLLEPTAEQIRESETRPPILLLPGLVSSRLIAWQHKKCRGPDINIQVLPLMSSIIL